MNFNDIGFFVAGVASSGYFISGSGTSGLGNVGDGFSLPNSNVPSAAPLTCPNVPRRGQTRQGEAATWRCRTGPTRLVNPRIFR
jgi:hypothetical protein